MKFFLVFLFLLLETGYAGNMVLNTNDRGVIKTVSDIPVISDFFYEYRIRETRANAEAGDVHEMMAFYFKAASMKREEDKAYAMELLEASGSATAELFLFAEKGGTIESQPSREFLLLIARAMKENIRPYLSEGDDNRAFTHQARQYAKAFEVLQQKAATGDSDAKWVMDHLELEDVITDAG